MHSLGAVGQIQVHALSPDLATHYSGEEIQTAQGDNRDIAKCEEARSRSQ